MGEGPHMAAPTMFDSPVAGKLEETRGVRHQTPSQVAPGGTPHDRSIPWPLES